MARIGQSVIKSESEADEREYCDQIPVPVGHPVSEFTRSFGRPVSVDARLQQDFKVKELKIKCFQ